MSSGRKSKLSLTKKNLQQSSLQVHKLCNMETSIICAQAPVDKTVIQSPSSHVLNSQTMRGSSVNVRKIN